MPRKDNRSGGKSSSADGYYNKRNEELKQSSKASSSAAKRGDFVDLYNEGRADLQAAQWKSAIGGLPIIGPLVKGIEGWQQLEDLYNTTGKVPAYPAMDGRASGIGYTASNLAFSAGNKIFDGAHDLYQFYTGEADAFRNSMNYSFM